MIITDLDFLRKPCREASILEAGDIIQKLEEELHNSLIGGVGLSANQIGILKKVCIIRTPKLSLDLVNPIILEQYDLCSFGGDGCLSIPGVYITTQRYNEIFLKDIMHPNGIIAVGLEAVIIEHECDHLNNILMIDRQIKIPKQNDKCWCGSEKKYKKCHFGKEIK